MEGPALIAYDSIDHKDRLIIYTSNSDKCCQLYQERNELTREFVHAVQCRPHRKFTHATQVLHAPDIDKLLRGTAFYRLKMNCDMRCELWVPTNYIHLSNGLYVKFTVGEDPKGVTVLLARRLDLWDLNLTSALYLSQDEFKFLYDHLQGIQWACTVPESRITDNIFNPEVSWECYGGSDGYGLKNACVKLNYKRPAEDL